MFERFTDRSRRVIVLSQEAARLRNAPTIDTSHLLFALAHEGEGVAARALAAVGVRAHDVEPFLGTIAGPTRTGHIGFTVEAKKSFELALREALQLGHDYIGTEHILLALLRQDDTDAREVLDDLGADVADIRTEVITMLSRYDPGINPLGRPELGRSTKKPDPVDLVDEFLAQLGCTNWGRGFDIINPGSRRKAAVWLAAQMKSFTEWGAENGRF